VRIALQVVIIGAALTAGLMPISGTTIERRFSTTVYPAVQRVITPITNVVPIALFDLLTVAGAIAIIWSIVHSIRRARRERSPRPLLATLRQLATAGAIVYLAFLILWGFNYRRVAMTERLVMARPAPATDAVVALGLDAVRRLNELHAGAHAIGWARDPRENASLLDAYAVVQQRLSDAPAAVPGRLKRTLYGPYFRWTSIDGMVNPFALEVLANPDLLPYERPFVAAHEWAHLAGYADESEANFVGWLTCVRADVPSQYSGWMSLYWQIAGELSAADRASLWDALGEGPRADVQAIVERMRRGQLPLLRNASWRVYDSYLRANRVEEGIRSYGKVITLLLRAKFEDGWLPVRQGSAASSR
jgi:hypothetical protein